MEISQFGDSIPQKELTYIDMGHLIHFDFRKAGAFPHVEDDVLETAEGLPAKKAQPQGTTKHYTIQNYSVLQRTTTYKVLRRTTKYPLLQTRKYYAVLPSIPPYYKALLRTTKYYQCILHGKYNISRSGALPEIWPNAAPTTKSATPKSSNTTLVTKSKTPKSTNGARAVESDSPTSPNVAPATENVIV